MRTIAIINLKGGTAKTTTTVNLAAELRHRGKRVLCIDADPQHNLTDFLGASTDGTTITDLLAGRVCEADAAVQRLGAGFGIVPSDLSLCEIDIEAIQKGISLRTVRDLCEAAALGHDLGHTPFGHAGERVLNELSPEGFAHNEQSLRVVDLLERDGDGLNLTYEVRNGIVCHTGKQSAATPEGKIIKFADRITTI